MLAESIETKRLLLRRPLPEDAEAIFEAYAQDREVTRYLVWRPHASVETTREFTAHCLRLWESAKAFPYVITRKGDGELLGMIELRPNGHRAEFGFVLARRFWGQGLMTEAVSALVAIALAQPSIFSGRGDVRCGKRSLGTRIGKGRAFARGAAAKEHHPSEYFV